MLWRNCVEWTDVTQPRGQSPEVTDTTTSTTPPVCVTKSLTKRILRFYLEGSKLVCPVFASVSYHKQTIKKQSLDKIISLCLSCHFYLHDTIQSILCCSQRYIKTCCSRCLVLNPDMAHSKFETVVNVMDVHSLIITIYLSFSLLHVCSCCWKVYVVPLPWSQL